ncbi:MAG: tRNA (adenine-N1)-methyltransferase [candidate division WOR-3 bacterium]|nr:tRNA (adenine-N1)-methyltransferase [candidate division WOR-3 bacterium]MCX7837618.1 tRNA (adenine-N1)-methyltransferase [candidate division WOR-3 bacterium]MDW8114028.1 tRNA (adenine-N1)-methyltransferase [candidate division WOR-3 bacterium]
MLKPNDLVLLYHSENAKYLITLPESGELQTHKGVIKLNEIFQKNYGDEISTHRGEKFYILKPTIADIEMKVKRTTTIIYPKDAGVMLLKTNLFPGAKVVEVGTGSGAFTIILANFVRPSGIVYSYEVREDFLKNAQENVKRAGLENNVIFYLRDVVKEGFLEEDNSIDSVYIDLPEPWEVIKEAHRILKGGHSLISLNPNVEQIQKTFRTLELIGFTRIKVYEILEREILVRYSGTRPKEFSITHTAYLLFANKVNKR